MFTCYLPACVQGIGSEASPGCHSRSPSFRRPRTALLPSGWGSEPPILLTAPCLCPAALPDSLLFLPATLLPLAASGWVLAGVLHTALSLEPLILPAPHQGGRSSLGCSAGRGPPGRGSSSPYVQSTCGVSLQRQGVQIPCVYEPCLCRQKRGWGECRLNRRWPGLQPHGHTTWGQPGDSRGPAWGPACCQLGNRLDSLGTARGQQGTSLGIDWTAWGQPGTAWGQPGTAWGQLGLRPSQQLILVALTEGLGSHHRIYSWGWFASPHTPLSPAIKGNQRTRPCPTSQLSTPPGPPDCPYRQGLPTVHTACFCPRTLGKACRIYPQQWQGLREVIRELGDDNPLWPEPQDCLT